MEKSSKKTGWSKFLSGNTYSSSFSSSFANLTGKNSSASNTSTADSNCSSTLTSTTFFEDINKGVITLPDENGGHIHTVVCPTTGSTALPKHGAPDSIPFYSWLKSILNTAPAAGTPLSAQGGAAGNMNLSSPLVIRSPQLGSAGPPLHGIGAGSGGLGSATSANGGASFTCAGAVVSPTSISSTSPEMNFSSTLPPIPIESVRAASALGCSALLLRIASYEDATKEPRTISIQINDAQLRSCKIPGGKKRSLPRVVSEVFLFPTLEESVDIHVTIGMSDNDSQLSSSNWDDSVSMTNNATNISSSNGRTPMALVKAKAVLDAMLHKSSSKSTSSSAFKTPSNLNTGFLATDSIQLEAGNSEKDSLDIIGDSGLKTASIWEPTSLLSVRKQENTLASTIFHVDLASAARSGGLQWFELIVPASNSAAGPGPWGFSRLVASVAALYASTPARSMWRPRTASLLSLVPLPSDHQFISKTIGTFNYNDDNSKSHSTQLQADYLTLLQTGSSPKIPTWRRFWAVVVAGRILLYPYQHKEVCMPLLNFVTILFL